MFDRIKETLRTLADQKVIYVESAKRENQIIQLMYFRDDIVGLDAQGKLWSYNPSERYWRLLTESPTSD
jgi:hypothetical protein